MNRQIEVGVLGATGVVGQQFISRMARHPWFNVTWLAASERSKAAQYPGGTVAPRRADAGSSGDDGRCVCARTRTQGRLLRTRCLCCR